MTITIGGAALKTVPRPANLDDRLLAASGRNAAETAQALAGEPLAGHVAVAVAPFLKDAPEHAALAQQIAEAGVLDVAAAVLALYGSEATADE